MHGATIKMYICTYLFIRYVRKVTKVDYYICHIRYQTSEADTGSLNMYFQ